MKTISSLIIGLSLLIISTELISQNTTSLAWKTLSGENYEIQYPSDWELDQSGQMGTTFMLFSAVENDADLFKENLTLIIQDLSGHNLDLDEYTALSLEQIETLITSSNILESKRRKAKNGDYHQLIYTGKQGIYDLKFLQYFWVEENAAYLLTFTCEVKSFKKFQTVGEKIMDSFIIK